METGTQEASGGRAFQLCYNASTMGAVYTLLGILPIRLTMLIEMFAIGAYALHGVICYV